MAEGAKVPKTLPKGASAPDTLTQPLKQIKWIFQKGGLLQKAFSKAHCPEFPGLRPDIRSLPAPARSAGRSSQQGPSHRVGQSTR